ncbi:MAG: hypothetical protein AB1793_08460 [Candidatus Thermoplasmatota archaeon]
MIYRKEHLDDLAKAKLAKSAYDLGIDVGERGHADDVGWVAAELRHILIQAEELDLVDIVRRRYEFGKEKGRLRQQTRLSQTAASLTSDETDGSILRQHPDRFVERVSAEEGIWSTISVMRYARGDEGLQSHIGNLLSGIVDLHDRIMQMPPAATAAGTFDSALRMISDVGWISTYEISFFDERSAMAKVDTTSMLARSFGKCDSPMCLPIGNIMETAGLRTFGRPMVAVEEACMAQGHDRCTFKLFPRVMPG